MFNISNFEIKSFSIIPMKTLIKDNLGIKSKNYIEKEGKNETMGKAKNYRDWKGKNKLCKWQKSKGSGANSIIEKQEIEHGYGKNCKNEKLT